MRQRAFRLRRYHGTKGVPVNTEWSWRFRHPGFTVAFITNLDAGWAASVQPGIPPANEEGKNMNQSGIIGRLFSEESGQDLIEYGLIAALIALAAVSIMGTVGNSIANVFNNVNNNL